MIRVVAMVAMVGCSASGPEIEKRTAVEHGRDLFSSPRASTSTLNAFSCATCHAADPATIGGRVLPGSVLAGAIERPTYWGGEQSDLLRAINTCRSSFMYAPKPWTRDDEDARVLFAYLASLPRAEPGAQPFTVVRVAVDLPRGDPTRGRAVYDAACRSCHGAAHTGDGAIRKGIVALPEESVRSFRESFGFSDRDIRLAFIEKIRHGPFLGLSGTMPPFSREVLPDLDVAALLSFLGLSP